jgi:hypothetical protein
LPDEFTIAFKIIGAVVLHARLVKNTGRAKRERKKPLKRNLAFITGETPFP